MFSSKTDAPRATECVPTNQTGVDVQNPTCSIAECKKHPDAAKGMCWAHYRRMRTYGAAAPAIFPPKPPKPPKIVPPTRAEELQRMVEQESDDCIEWPYLKLPTGYGRVSWHGETVYTHRLALEFVGREPADGETVVRHLCHNPPCVNPAHLAWGTQQDNIDDRSERGVWHEAMEKRFESKITHLSQHDRQQIVRYLKVGMPATAIAHRYGIAPQTVHTMLAHGTPDREGATP